MTNTKTKTQERLKKSQEECINVYRLEYLVLIYKGPLAHDTHCPLEDKDKDRMHAFKDIKCDILTSQQINFLTRA